MDIGSVGVDGTVTVGGGIGAVNGGAGAGATDTNVGDRARCCFDGAEID